jgi:hypothetical protein
MKLPELRIGNFFEIQLSYEDNTRIGSITEISKRQVHIDGKWLNLDRLIPISITEDVLLHADFTQFGWAKDSSVFECHYFKCTLDGNGVNLFCENLKNLKPISYLHELQNLHFDLTGEELNINFDNIKTPKTEMV